MAAMVAGCGVAGERRRYPRTKIIESQLLTVNVALGAPGCDERQQRGIVIDLGEGGLAVQPFLPLSLGTVGDLRLDLPGAVRPFATTGMVAWVGYGGRAGIRFIGLSAEARAQLRGWLSPDSALPATTEPQLAVQVAPALSSDTVSAEFDFDAGLRLVAERALLIAAASGVAIALGDSNGMVCRASVGTAPDVGVRLQPHTGLSGYCLRSGQTVHCTDTQSDPRVDAVAAHQLNLGSIIVIPVFAGSELSGLLEVLSASSYAFDAHQVARLDRLALLLGGMIEERNQALNSPPQKRTPELESLTGPRDGEFYAPEQAASPVASPPAPVFYGPSPAPAPAKTSISPSVIHTPAVQPVSSDSFPVLPTADAGFDQRPAPLAVDAPNLPANEVPQWNPADPQLCDACGHMNLPGAIDCERCDVPLPSALLRERSEGELSSSYPVPALVGNRAATVSHWSSGPAEYGALTAKTKPKAGKDAGTDHTHSSRTAATLGVIVILIAGVLGGWYIRRAQRQQALSTAVPLPAIKLPVAPRPQAAPSTNSATETPLDEPEITTRTWVVTSSTKPAVRLPGSPGQGASTPDKSSRAPAAANDKVSSSAGGPPEVRIVLSSLSFDGPERKHSRSQLLPGRLLHKVDPSYPQAALAGRISGDVALLATITKNGSMDNVKVVGGPEALRAAAVDAVRQWRYQPWQLDGRPVDVQTTMTVTFALPGER
jgi:protein TonB